MDTLVVLIVVLAALGLGAAAGYFIPSILAQKGVSAARQRASVVLEVAEEQKRRLLLEGKEEAERCGLSLNAVRGDRLPGILFSFPF